MTASLVPTAFSALSYPWCISDRDERRRALEEVPHTALQRSIALDALVNCLGFEVADTYTEDDSRASLSDDFHEKWFTYSKDFARRMPTFAEITSDAVRDWLEQDVNQELLFDSAGGLSRKRLSTR